MSWCMRLWSNLHVDMQSWIFRLQWCMSMQHGLPCWLWWVVWPPSVYWCNYNTSNNYVRPIWWRPGSTDYEVLRPWCWDLWTQPDGTRIFRRPLLKTILTFSFWIIMSQTIFRKWSISREKNKMIYFSFKEEIQISNMDVQQSFEANFGLLAAVEHHIKIRFFGR